MQKPAGSGGAQAGGWRVRMKTGVVDVGGGMRGIYAAGVLDGCLDRGIKFDLGIGVSAGSANIASYTAGQKGRNYRFYTEYSFRRQYMSFANLLRGGSYINMDYVYGELSRADSEDPLDYPAMSANPMEFIVVAADALSGEAKYFDKHDMAQDNYDVFKASSSIPVVGRPYTVDGRPYYDGALGDPVPVAKAFELGCDRVVLILTKPESELRSPGRDEKLARLLKRKYPTAAERLRLRAENYNAGVARAREYAREGRALIVSPDDTCGVSTLKRDRDSLRRLYDKGCADAAKIEAFLAE